MNPLYTSKPMASGSAFGCVFRPTTTSRNTAPAASISRRKLTLEPLGARSLHAGGVAGELTELARRRSSWTCRSGTTSVAAVSLPASTDVTSNGSALRSRALARRTSPIPSRRRGLLVAFEGPDGSGKTTQRKLFKTWLKAEGYDVVTTKWNSSDLIKPIIKSRKAVRALSPEEFSLLHAADFRHRVEQKILPALWDGKLVIADRFLFTGLARDVARGLDLDWVLKLYQPLLWPDLVFYFRGLAGHVEQARHRDADAELLRSRPGRHRTSTIRPTATSASSPG